MLQDMETTEEKKIHDENMEKGINDERNIVENRKIVDDSTKIELEPPVDLTLAPIQNELQLPTTSDVSLQESNEVERFYGSHRTNYAFETVRVEETQFKNGLVEAYSEDNKLFLLDQPQAASQNVRIPPTHCQQNINGPSSSKSMDNMHCQRVNPSAQPFERHQQRLIATNIMDQQLIDFYCFVEKEIKKSNDFLSLDTVFGQFRMENPSTSTDGLKNEFLRFLHTNAMMADSSSCNTFIKVFYYLRLPVQQELKNKLNAIGQCAYVDEDQILPDEDQIMQCDNQIHQYEDQILEYASRDGNFHIGKPNIASILKYFSAMTKYCASVTLTVQQLAELFGVWRKSQGLEPFRFNVIVERFRTTLAEFLDTEHPLEWDIRIKILMLIGFEIENKHQKLMVKAGIVTRDPVTNRIVEFTSSKTLETIKKAYASEEENKKVFKGMFKGMFKTIKTEKGEVAPIVAVNQERKRTASAAGFQPWALNERVPCNLLFHAPSSTRRRDSTSSVESAASRISLTRVSTPYSATENLKSDVVLEALHGAVQTLNVPFLKEFEEQVVEEIGKMLPSSEVSPRVFSTALEIMRTELMSLELNENGDKIDSVPLTKMLQVLISFTLRLRSTHLCEVRKGLESLFERNQLSRKMSAEIEVNEETKVHQALSEGDLKEFKICIRNNLNIDEAHCWTLEQLCQFFHEETRFVYSLEQIMEVGVNYFCEKRNDWKKEANIRGLIKMEVPLPVNFLKRLRAAGDVELKLGNRLASFRDHVSKERFGDVNPNPTPQDLQENLLYFLRHISANKEISSKLPDEFLAHEFNQMKNGVFNIDFLIHQMQLVKNFIEHSEFHARDKGRMALITGALISAKLFDELKKTNGQLRVIDAGNGMFLVSVYRKRSQLRADKIEKSRQTCQQAIAAFRAQADIGLGQPMEIVEEEEDEFIAPPRQASPEPPVKKEPVNNETVDDELEDEEAAGNQLREASVMRNLGQNGGVNPKVLLEAMDVTVQSLQTSALRKIQERIQGYMERADQYDPISMETLNTRFDYAYNTIGREWKEAEDNPRSSSICASSLISSIMYMIADLKSEELLESMDKFKELDYEFELQFARIETEEVEGIFSAFLLAAFEVPIRSDNSD